MTIHRLRLSDEEISVITEALEKLARKSEPYDTAKKILIVRTHLRFKHMAQDTFERPRKQKYHRELLKAYHSEIRDSKDLS